MTDAATVAGCPSCGAARLPEEQFCEACGTSLPPVAATAAEAAGPTCPSCGTVGQFADGYCLVCGMREPRPRDHEERAGPGWAGVSDRGRRHHRNEDAFATAVRDDGCLVVAVSDGVSTTLRPDDASAAAVAAAVAVLTAPGEPDFGAALDAARQGVGALDFEPDPELGPPSCTLLLAVVGDREVRFGTLGDCRAYWTDAGGARQLTIDDSWATEQLSAGGMSSEEVWADPRAHVITRWLGVDGDPSWEPRPVLFEPPGPGRLVLCSDGLWNYLADPEALVAAIGDRTDLAAIARALTDHANSGGGHDNITVVVVGWPVPSGGHPRTPGPFGEGEDRV